MNNVVRNRHYSGVEPHGVALDHLVGSAARGDSAAFAELVTPPLHRALVLATLAVGRDDAPDVVQESLLQAWRGLSTLRDRNAFPAWFQTIVVRTAWRSAKRHRHVAVLDDRWVDPSPGPERVIASRDIGDAFARLTAQDRLLLALRFRMDLSYEQAARVLGVPAGTVKSRVHYALGRLREGLDGE